MSNKLLDHDGVIAKFGVKPSQIVDYLALIGDSSDNIPGIDKVGPKTAVKWLAQWPSIAEIISNADQIKGKVGDNLRNNLANLNLYQQLVTIDTAIDVSIDQIIAKPDMAKAKEMLADFGFNSWLQQISKKKSLVLPKVIEIFNDQDWQEIENHLLADKKLVFHCFVKSNTYVLLLTAKGAYSFCWQQLTNSVQNKLQLCLQATDLQLIGHNCKNSLHILNNCKIELARPPIDVLLAAYLLNSSDQNYDLSSLSWQYLDYQSVCQQDDANMLRQSAEILLIIKLLHEKLIPVINESSKMQYIFENIDLPLAVVLAKVEQHGALLDVKMLAQQSKDLALKIAALEEKAYQMASQEFNLNSPKQLREILFDELKLPQIKKTSSGEASTSEEVLQKLVDQHEIIAVILQHRHFSKLQNTYCSKLTAQVDNNGRVHCSYNQALTSTGRLSAQQPNLQNIPIKSVEGRKIRKSFIAPAGYKIISADYNQVELCIMAHFSLDVSLCNALRNNEDVHAAVAAETFGCSIDQVTAEQRRQAKVINFGLMYGMSAFGLAEQLNIDNFAAKQLIERYFDKFPKIKEYLEKTREFAKNKGYVETFLGRRIYFAKHASGNLQAAVARAAINAPIQGSAAELIKKAMILLHEQIKDIDAKIIMQVHDELVLEVLDSQVEEVVLLITASMEQALGFAVPLKVSVGIGQHWGAAH